MGSAMKAWFERQLETAWGLIEKGPTFGEGEDWFDRARSSSGAASGCRLWPTMTQPRRSAIGVLSEPCRAANQRSRAAISRTVAQTEPTHRESVRPLAWEKALQLGRIPADDVGIDDSTRRGMLAAVVGSGHKLLTKLPMVRAISDTALDP